MRRISASADSGCANASSTEWASTASAHASETERIGVARLERRVAYAVARGPGAGCGHLVLVGVHTDDRPHGRCQVEGELPVAAAHVDQVGPVGQVWQQEVGV